MLGNTSPRLLVRIRFVAEPGIRGGKVKPRSENRRGRENTPRRNFLDNILERDARFLISARPELTISLKHEGKNVLGVERLSWTGGACCLLSPEDCFVEVAF